MTRLEQVGGALVLVAALLAPRAAQARPALTADNPFLGVPVSGTSVDGNTFDGTMDIGGFISGTDAGGNPIVQAVGALTGTITTPDGRQRQVSNVAVLMPLLTAPPAVLVPQQVTCNILHLVLGPLNLNLLGLTVHLNRVILDVTAVSGPGNLLGNLLCAITNLLNGINLGGLTLGQIVAALVALLNQLIGVL